MKCPASCLQACDRVADPRLYRPTSPPFPAPEDRAARALRCAARCARSALMRLARDSSSCAGVSAGLLAGKRMPTQRPRPDSASLICMHASRRSEVVAAAAAVASCHRRRVLVVVVEWTASAPPRRSETWNQVAARVADDDEPIDDTHSTRAAHERTAPSTRAVQTGEEGRMVVFAPTRSSCCCCCPFVSCLCLGLVSSRSWSRVQRRRRLAVRLFVFRRAASATRCACDSREAAHRRNERTDQTRAPTPSRGSSRPRVDVATAQRGRTEASRYGEEMCTIMCYDARGRLAEMSPECG